MCTAVAFKSGNHYFGRNLDVIGGYGERVLITPRNYKFSLRKGSYTDRHYAIVGMGIIADGYPLYFEAVNEKGLGVAGLNFPDNAYYSEFRENKNNVTPYEFIPWILRQCKDTGEARKALQEVNIIALPFSEKLPLTPLHWMISDGKASLAVESTRDGVKVYENPFDILTNNPPFDYHMMNMNNYMQLYEGRAENRLSKNREFSNYSLGMGALGLPGDFSSVSRFVRAYFVKEKSPVSETEKENVSQFFHILSSVAMPKGCVMMADGEYEYTRYSCCCNTDKGIYYYNTYDEPGVKSVCLWDEDIDSDSVIII